MRRNLGAAMLGVIGVVLMASSAAWACTLPVRAITAAPGLGSPGTAVSIQGTTMATEVRWSSVTGPVLANVTADPVSETFSGQITVPDVTPGTYEVVALAEGRLVARTRFQVTRPAAPADSSAAVDLVSGQDEALLRAAGRTAPPTHGAPSALGPEVLLGGMLLLAGGTAVVLVRRRRAPAGR